VLWTVFFIFWYASLRLLWTFSSKWSKCMRWGSVIAMGKDILFEIFRSANVEIVCAVNYFSCYCCCRSWSFGIEYSLQCPSSRGTRTLSSRMFCDSCLRVYFLTRGRSWCSSSIAFTKDTCDGMRANMVFCSTRVLAYLSFTFNHPFANRRIFLACVWIPPVFFSWNHRSPSFCFFSVFFLKETGLRNGFWNCLCCCLQLAC
jgi:hypothetical protein